jgi:hypothetical protein
MLISRSDLRLALVAGLTNGLGAISGIPFSYYAPMAVLAVCSGSYGNTLELGRQRLLGSLLGGVILTLGLGGLQQLPLPVALAISLGAMRLLGGVLGLRVGYKVGGFVVVMGWLVHRQAVLDWLPLRLVWTALGIVLASLSLRLLWPARAIVACETAMASLIERLAASLATAAASLDPGPGCGDAAPPPPRAPGSAAAVRAPAPVPSPPGLTNPQALPLQTDQTESLVAALEAIRRSLPQAQQELGANPERHPRIRLLRLLDGSCSQLLGVYDELARQPLPPIRSRNLAEVPVVEAALLLDLSQRLRLWAAALRQPHRQDWRQPLPAAESPDSAWRRLDALLHQRDLPERDLPDLYRHAAILSLLGLAMQQLNETEESWRNLGRTA